MNKYTFLGSGFAVKNVYRESITLLSLECTIMLWIANGNISPLHFDLFWPQEVNCTLFLLAGYAKYGRPYAWIRSNHERLVNIGGTDALVKDTPMKLKSVTDWQTQGMGGQVLQWDVLRDRI